MTRQARTSQAVSGDLRARTEHRRFVVTGIIVKRGGEVIHTSCLGELMQDDPLMPALRIHAQARRAIHVPI